MCVHYISGEGLKMSGKSESVDCAKSNRMELYPRGTWLLFRFFSGVMQVPESFPSHKIIYVKIGQRLVIALRALCPEMLKRPNAAINKFAIRSINTKQRGQSAECRCQKYNKIKSK